MQPNYQRAQPQPQPGHNFCYCLVRLLMTHRLKPVSADFIGSPEDTFPGLYDRLQQNRSKAGVGGPGLVLGQVEGKVVVLG